MATQVMPQISDQRRHLTELKKIVVGHDFSEAAGRALADAMTLARRFQAEIVVAHAASSNFDGSEFLSFRGHDQRVHADMENLRRRMGLAGHQCKDIVRSGGAAATLYDVADEERADLLLVGAYGNGSKERTTLGSTAELLLRSIPCPVLIYGPKITRSLFRDKEAISILVPVELPCDPRCLSFAIDVAKLFKAKLEVLHVVDMSRAVSMPHAFQDMQYTCEEIASHLRAGGVEVAGSLLFGKPDEAIVSRSQELQSAFILMPLETRGHLSSAKSDNVATNVIRNAEVPVMTYRINLGIGGSTLQ